MSNLRKLLFEPCPYCLEYAEDNQPCGECDGRGFFLRDIIADRLGEELLEAVAAAEKTEAQRDLLLALLKRTAKILVELDNFYPDAMPDDIDDLIIGAADAITLAVTEEGER